MIRVQTVLALALDAALSGCAGSTRFDPQPDEFHYRPHRAYLPAAAIQGDNVGPQSDAAAAAAPQPASRPFVWARTDGRRMATDPVLRRTGERDRAECGAAALVRVDADMPLMESCMSARGYYRRDT
jgi:hypothetical protein